VHITEFLKIVIDEIFDNGEMRILRSRRKKSRMNSTAWDDFRIWDNDKEEIISPEKLKELLGWKRLSAIVEGRVFLKTPKETIDVTKDVRKKVKERYLKLLEREGK